MKQLVPHLKRVLELTWGFLKLSSGYGVIRHSKGSTGFAERNLSKRTHMNKTSVEFAIHRHRRSRRCRLGSSMNLLFFSSQHGVKKDVELQTSKTPKDSKGSKGPRTPPRHSTSHRVPRSGHLILRRHPSRGTFSKKLRATKMAT